MSQKRYEHLFARIHAHCQQIAQDALRFRPYVFERTLEPIIGELSPDPAQELYVYMMIEEDKDAWYVDTPNSFLSLRRLLC